MATAALSFGLPLAAKLAGNLFGRKGPSVADQYRQRVAGLGGDLDKAKAAYSGGPAALAGYDPYEGAADEAKAVASQLAPGFQEQLQSIRERGAKSGTFRSGNQAYTEERSLASYEKQVADAIAQSSTYRAALALQQREAVANQYSSTVSEQSQLYSGMADYNQSASNANKQGLFGLAGNVLNAGARIAPYFLNRKVGGGGSDEED